MNLPSVSIIVPVYNVANYIIECLQSVAHQTYSGKIECLVVDDCGTDESIELAKQFISENKGPVDFKIVSRLSNGGLSEARNSGIRAASGEYLYFLDSDDYLLPETISTLINVTRMYPSTDLVFSDYQIQKGGRKELNRSLNRNLNFFDNRIIHSKKIYQPGFIRTEAWNKLVRSRWLKENELFFETMRISEDLIWTFKSMCCTPNIAYNHSVTYVYRVRENSIVTQKNETTKMRTIESLKNNYLDMVRSYDLMNVNDVSMLNYLYLSKINVIKVGFAKKCDVSFLKKTYKEIHKVHTKKWLNCMNMYFFVKFVDFLPFSIGFCIISFFAKLKLRRNK